MFTINRNIIDNETKIANAKSNSGKSVPRLYQVFKKKIWNLIDITSEFSSYEMAHWINNTDRWLHNKNNENLKYYKRSLIVNVDLGASNFKFEPSFVHPCIVLQNRRNSILIVPCSSKKYGKGFREIIDATRADGFVKDTGVQMESIRWVHKNRIVSSFGQASSGLMNKIDDYQLKNIPTYKKEKAIFDGQIAELIKKDVEIEQLKQQVKELEEQLQTVD